MNLKTKKRTKEQKIRKDTTNSSRYFIIALSVVSILGFLDIVMDSLFYFSFADYMNTLWLIVLGVGLILETTIEELKSIQKRGLTSDYLGKVTMIIVGGIAIIAGILSIPQIDIQNPSFLAVKGIVGILAITLIVLQTWVANEKRDTKNKK